MKTVCIDDDLTSLRGTVSLCREMLSVTDLMGFSDGADALAYIKAHPTDLVILETETPGLDGFALAREIRCARPETAILFLTADPGHALAAWELHAAGYILKPLTRERLALELSAAGTWRRKRAEKRPVPHIQARTFGNFDLLVDGRTVVFSRSRAKELLAYLVDKKGIRVTRREAFRVLWGEEEYTRPGQKMLDVIVRSLRATLEENGISEILKLEGGTLRIVPKSLECDMYRLFAGDEEYEDAYQGEYMGSYSWANLTEGTIDSELTRRRTLRSLYASGALSAIQ